MPRPSKIDRLPSEIREEIGALRERGYTIEEILGHLRALDIPHEAQPSWSGLQRHIQGLDKLSERLQRHRVVAEALVRRLGDAPESKQARLNIEMMHTIITDLGMAVGDGDGDGEPVTLDPAQVHFLAKALDHLERAEKNNIETTLKLRDVKAAEADRVSQPDGAREVAGPDYQLPSNGR